ncbi:MAG: hypothetical protein M9962_07240 [Oligoflexia bacterium]|nr:hypothetical protein [Oligoflexia bacterium]
MKTLTLAFGLILTSLTSVQAASNVSVMIDGQNYSCSQGGSSPGNRCECVVLPYRSGYEYYAYKNGTQIHNGYTYDTEAEASSRCRQYIISNSSCYQ